MNAPIRVSMKKTRKTSCMLARNAPELPGVRGESPIRREKATITTAMLTIIPEFRMVATIDDARV